MNINSLDVMQCWSYSWSSFQWCITIINATISVIVIVIIITITTSLTSSRHHYHHHRHLSVDVLGSIGTDRQEQTFNLTIVSYFNLHIAIIIITSPSSSNIGLTFDPGRATGSIVVIIIIWTSEGPDHAARGWNEVALIFVGVVEPTGLHVVTWSEHAATLQLFF